MSRFQINMKDLSASTEWADVTPSCIATSFSIRKGFNSLGRGSDVGKLTVTYKPDNLAAAVLFHTTAKQVQVYRDGALLFEGYTEGKANIEATARSSTAWVKLSVMPYSEAFEAAVAPSELVFESFKICDPADTANSLLHTLVDLIYSNLDSPLKEILAGVTDRVLCDVSITKVLPIAIIEEGDSILDALDDMLGEYGLSRYMEGTQMVIVEPYAEDSRVVQNVPYTSVVASPSINSAPYAVTNKAIVTLGKPVVYEDEVLFTLYEDDESPSQNERINPQVPYPEDGDLECDYEPERAEDNDTLELIYTTGRSYTYLAREAGGTEVDLEVTKEELGATSAAFRFLYTGASYAYINQLTISAERAYYRDTSTVVEDSTIKGNRDTEDVESVYMVDVDDAKKWIQTYRAECKAETQSFTFQSDRVSLQPNTLITLGDIAVTILIRYSELDLMTGLYTYEGVAYNIQTIATTARRKATSTSGTKFININLSGNGYIYDQDGNLTPPDQLINATLTRFGTVAPPVWYVNGEKQTSTEVTIPVPASYMTDRSYITVRCEVADMSQECYIFRYSEGTAIVVQYARGASDTVPPMDVGVFLQGGVYSFWDGKIMGEFTGQDWSDEPPARTDETPWLWMRVSTDGGTTWQCSMISGDPARDFSIVVPASYYGLSSRGLLLADVTFTFTIERQNMPTPDAVWTTSIDGNDYLVTSAKGDAFVVTLKAGFTVASFVVQCTVGTTTKRVMMYGVKDSQKSAIYLGKWPEGTEPETTDEGALEVGDYYLKTTTDGDRIPMYWTGTQWQAVSTSSGNFAEVMSGVFADAIDSEATLTTASALYALIQNLAAINAFVRNLHAYNLMIEKSGFSFVVQATDAEGNDLAEPIIKAEYGGSVVWQIVPSTGRIFFGSPNSTLDAPLSGFMYDPSDGAIRSVDNNLVIGMDGRIVASNLKATGAQLEDALISKNSYLYGNIDTDSFSALPSESEATVYTVSCSNGAESQCRTLDSWAEANGFYHRNLKCVHSADSSVRYVECYDSYSQYFYDANGVEVGRIYRQRDLYTYYYSSTWESISFTLTITVGGGQVFIFKNLPIAGEALETGQVYRDTSGILHVVTS